MSADEFRRWIVRIFYTGAAIATIIILFPSLPIWAFIPIGIGVAAIVDWVVPE